MSVKAALFFISTLSVFEAFSWRRFQDLSFLDHPFIVDTTPSFALTELRKLGHKEVDERSLAALLDAESNVKRLMHAGILIAAGTDAPYPGDFQGEGIHRELELLVESGLTPLEVITIAQRMRLYSIVNAEAEWALWSRANSLAFLLWTGSLIRISAIPEISREF